MASFASDIFMSVLRIVWEGGLYRNGNEGASLCGNLQHPLRPYTTAPIVDLSCGIWQYFTLNVLFM